jgi:hypothetical protein
MRLAEARSALQTSNSDVMQASIGTKASTNPQSDSGAITCVGFLTLETQRTRFSGDDFCLIL